MRRNDREISQEGWNRLLETLDPDQERAAHVYESIRRKLIRFFEWRRAPFPAECADLTVDRVISKIEKGEQIQDPAGYFYSVARLILLEQRKAHSAYETIDPALISDRPAASDGRPDPGVECLEDCLNALPHSQRDLLVEYYSEEGSAGIRARQTLAEQLGIPINALRIRAHRIRAKVEACVNDCIGRTKGTTGTKE